MGTVDEAVERALALLHREKLPEPRWILLSEGLFWFCDDCGVPIEVDAFVSIVLLECSCGWSRVLDLGGDDDS